MHIIIFENPSTHNFYPITLTRPSLDIFCGGTTLYNLLHRFFPKARFSFIVRDYLHQVVAETFKPAKVLSDKILMIDGSVVPEARVIAKLAREVYKGRDFVIKQGVKIIVAFFSCKSIDFQPAKLNRLKINQINDLLAILKLSKTRLPIRTFNHLWEIIVFNSEILRDNLDYLRQGLKQYKPKVYVGKNVKIAEQVVLDTASGPIIISDGTQIDSLVVLRGPLYIGKNCLVKSFAEIKASSSIGDVCKMGGEIEASIIQSYSNKQHYGYLGHAYVGSWVNLGAGTTNSDLKNTYGPLKMQGQATGQIFLGCVIGDYSKTAIGTLIYTAKVIGVNSMLYGTVVQDVPSFTNHAIELIECPLEVAWKMQKAMRARRGLNTNFSQRHILSEVYKTTAQNRKATGVHGGKLVIK
jgi:glucose-1-phosphate thymidylyltransferase